MFELSPGRVIFIVRNQDVNVSTGSMADSLVFSLSDVMLKLAFFCVRFSRAKANEGSLQRSHSLVNVHLHGFVLTSQQTVGS